MSSCPSRRDFPGSWHHVINRSVDQQPFFHGPSDVRLFLARLAREVKRGWLEVHSWCAMTTHYHLLVRSPRGQLSEAMRRIQNEYSRRFNLKQERQGALVRGRFISVPVESLQYRRIVVGYIDANPVRAGLAKRSVLYPHGSAAQYFRGHGPIWLERSWIESEVAEAMGASRFQQADYATVFENYLPEGGSRLVEARFGRTERLDPIDELFQAKPAKVSQWMLRRVDREEERRRFLPACDAGSILRVVDAVRTRYGPWTVRPHKRARDAWDLAVAGLLRDIAALTWNAMARAAGGQRTNICGRYLLHRRLMLTDPQYVARVGVLGSRALAQCLRTDGSAGTAEEMVRQELP